MIDLTVDETLAGERFDRALSRLLASSVRGARQLIEAGHATIDGKRAAPGATLRVGQRLHSPGVPSSDAQAPVPEPDAPLAVVHATDALLVVDKPAGQPCHPLRPGERGTLANALVARYPELPPVGEFPREAGLVNRIDNDTSGLVLVARSRSAWQTWRETSRQAQLRKLYLAVVEGELAPTAEWQELDAPLDHRGQKMRVVEPGTGQPALTRFRSLAAGRGASLLLVELRVGRRHQIRAHLAHLGHPLVGDALYGATTTGARPGHVLHAWRIRGQELDVKTPPPEEFWASAARFSIERREPRLEDEVERPT